MENLLTFTGPVKLLIIERALIEGKNKSRKERNREILTRLIIDKYGNPSSELKENSTVNYHYNRKHQITCKEEIGKTGELLEKIHFHYRDDLLSKKERFSSDNSLRETREYKYDDDKNLIFEKCGSRQIRFEYDSENRLLKEYRYFGKEPELALLYKRDKTGNISEIKTVDYKGNTIRLEKYKWEDELMIEHFCLNSGKVILRDDLYEYSCFHDGNWLKRVRYTLMSRNRREAVEVVYRSITYSDTCPETKRAHFNAGEILKEEKTALTFSDGSRYRGDLVNGKMEGYGYIQWPDGSSYKGDFKENQMNGKGILTWSNGDIYSGTFENGKMEGIGRLRWKKGKIFYGLFENDRRTNQGIIEEGPEELK